MIIPTARMIAIGAIILNVPPKSERDGRFFFSVRTAEKKNPGVGGGCCAVEDLLDPPQCPNMVSKDTQYGCILLEKGPAPPAPGHLLRALCPQGSQAVQTSPTSHQQPANSSQPTAAKMI